MTARNQRFNSFASDGEPTAAGPEQPVNENLAEGDPLSAGEEETSGGMDTFSASEARETVTRLEEEKQELIEQLQRERANFDNFRRISRQQQESAGEYTLCDFFKKLLPVLDDLERAIRSARLEGAAPSHTQGLEMIYNQLFKLLSQEGVCRIEAAGQSFDPNFHHAVAQVENEIDPDTGAAEIEKSGMVAEELTGGYTFKDRILRPSMVKVYK